MAANTQLVEALLAQRSMTQDRAEALLRKANYDLETALRFFDRVNRHRNTTRNARSGNVTPSYLNEADRAQLPQGHMELPDQVTPANLDSHISRHRHGRDRSLSNGHWRTPSVSSTGLSDDGRNFQAAPVSDIYNYPQLDQDRCMGSDVREVATNSPQHEQPLEEPFVRSLEQPARGESRARKDSIAPPILITPSADDVVDVVTRRSDARPFNNVPDMPPQIPFQSHQSPTSMPAAAVRASGLSDGHFEQRHTPSFTGPEFPKSIDPDETLPIIGSKPEAEELALQSVIQEWDFVLPTLRHNVELFNAGEEFGNFSLLDITAALTHGADATVMQRYFSSFDPVTICEAINDPVVGVPSIFYIVGINDEELLRLWLSYGANPNAMHFESQVPLLAFAVVDATRAHADTTSMVTTLLSAGADPNVLPAAFYSPCLKDIPDSGPRDSDLGDIKEPNKRWCGPDTRARLSKAINLSQRYFLNKAARMKPASVRQVELARRRKAQGLLGLPYFMVGQTLAAKFLVQSLLLHIAEPRKRPLVLTFAGPSGHGKTAMARRLGKLLSLELELVDCTIFNQEMELFGPRAPFVHSERGSPLNNFLARNHGQRCIVFMDEFEKTNADIHKALLIPFDNGEYQDRRHLTTIDCSQTIWILATNAHDAVIQAFCEENSKTLFVNDDESEQVNLMKKLAKEVRQDFLKRFQPPLAGRISAFVPFLPFSLEEQAVVVHKYIQDVRRDILKPVNLEMGPEERLVGNVRLHLRRDATVCKALADQEYHSDLGARSLIGAVDSLRRLLFQTYFEINEEFAANAETLDLFIDMDGDEVVIKQAKSKIET